MSTFRENKIGVMSHDGAGGMCHQLDEKFAVDPSSAKRCLNSKAVAGNDSVRWYLDIESWSRGDALFKQTACCFTLPELWRSDAA